MNLAKPLVALTLVTTVLFAVVNALNYALLASLILTALYLLVLIAVPSAKRRL